VFARLKILDKDGKEVFEARPTRDVNDHATVRAPIRCKAAAQSDQREHFIPLKTLERALVVVTKCEHHKSYGRKICWSSIGSEEPISDQANG